MSARFAELAYRETAMGALSLRRRREPTLGVDVYEVKLGDEFLMSSLFTVAEQELARLALAELDAPQLDAPQLDVVVGGLGLGYTARAALQDPRVRSLTVVEALAPVIEWHRDALLPEAADLVTDPRTRLVHGSFFDLAASAGGFTAQQASGVDAVLLDIDHSPSHLLHPDHAGFYTAAGLRSLARHLAPGGVFAMWADGAPDPSFRDVLADVFATARAEVVRFPNHLTGEESASTVYLAS